MRPKRLFASIDVPGAFGSQLAALDPDIPGVRWLSPEQMHLTLGFFGDVCIERDEKLRANLETIRWTAFFLPIRAVGAFPSKGRPKVIWAGVGRGHPHLFQIHKRVQEAALAAGLEPDLRPWHPHITVGRCRDVSADAIRPFLKRNCEFEVGLLRVESFALNSSQIGPDGSVYTRELVLLPNE